jgi:hypothetical protein
MCIDVKKVLAEQETLSLVLSDEGYGAQLCMLSFLWAFLALT